MENKDRILQYVRAHPGRTVAEIAEGARWPLNCTRSILKELRRDGLVRSREV